MRIVGMNKKVLHFRKSARGAVLRWGGAGS